MKDLDDETLRLLDALAGKRSGTPAEQAMRRALRDYAQALDQAPASQIHLSERDIDRREATRRVLIDAGALPVPRPIDASSTSEGASGRGAWRPLRGSPTGFGLAAGGGLMALALAVFVALGPDNDSRAPTLASRESTTVVVANHDAFCGDLRAKLQASLPTVQVQSNPSANSCTLQIDTLDRNAQQVASKILAEAGVQVTGTASMRVEVIDREAGIRTPSASAPTAAADDR